jgi:hypothetical protein
VDSIESEENVVVLRLNKCEQAWTETSGFPPPAVEGRAGACLYLQLINEDRDGVQLVILVLTLHCEQTEYVLK